MSHTGRTGLTVAFLGTPTFAATILHALAQSPHRVVRVITQPDRQRGRGMRRVASPVAAAADELGLPLTKAPAGAHGRLNATLRGDRPDVIVTAAWAGMVRQAERELAGLAALNVHASLLPRWRGAAPIERAIMAGDTVTGITLIHMSDELDAGDILLAREQPIPAERDAGWLREQLARLAAEVLLAGLELVAAGVAPRYPQPADGITIARKLTSEDERIDWHQPAPVIRNRVRALAPKPGAFFELNSGRVIVTAADVESRAALAPGQPAAPGTVTARDGQALVVAAGEGTLLRLVRVKPAGGREMGAGAWGNGRHIVPGQVLTEGRAQDVPLG